MTRDEGRRGPRRIVVLATSAFVVLAAEPLFLLVATAVVVVAPSPSGSLGWSSASWSPVIRSVAFQSAPLVVIAIRFVGMVARTGGGRRVVVGLP